MYAQHSGPINEMQYLQGQNLTAAGGDVTMAKVDNLIKRIGQNADDDPFGAGSVTDQTMQRLTGLRDDLRIAETAEKLGKSKGTDTAQKLTSDDLNQGQTPLGNTIGKAGGIAGKAVGTTVGGVVGGHVGAPVAGALIGGSLGEAWDQ